MILTYFAGGGLTNGFVCLGLKSLYIFFFLSFCYFIQCLSCFIFSIFRKQTKQKSQLVFWIGFKNVFMQAYHVWKIYTGMRIFRFKPEFRFFMFLKFTQFYLFLARFGMFLLNKIFRIQDSRFIYFHNSHA
jgi:hypothetical protein